MKLKARFKLHADVAQCHAQSFHLARMHFPAEIEECLIDSVLEGDTATLQICSLVCRTWRPRSQYRLFNKTISFVSRDSGGRGLEDLKSFLDFARSSPIILHSLHGLRIPHTALTENTGNYPFSNLRVLEIVGTEGGTTHPLSLPGPVHLESTLSKSILLFLKARTIHQLRFERLRIDDISLLPILEALGCSSSGFSPSVSSLRLLGFRTCSFIRRPVTENSIMLKFQNLALSLREVEAFENFTRTFEMKGLHAFFLCNPHTMSEEISFRAVGELINQHRREVRCISISRLTYDTPIGKRPLHSYEFPP